MCTVHCTWYKGRVYHSDIDCASEREEVQYTVHKLHQLLSTLMSLWSPEELCSQNCFFYFGYCWLWSAKLPWNHTFEVLKRCLVNVMVMVNDHYHDIHCWDNDDDFFECDFSEYDDDDFFDCDTCINSLSWIPERSFGADPTVERWIDLM